LSHLFRAILLIAAAQPVEALVIRGYNAAVHDRFSSGFPAAPVMNANFIHNASRFTGVGWWFIANNPSASDIQFTLVSPRHVLSVRHLGGNFTGGGQLVRFVAADGQVHTRTVGPFSNISVAGDVKDLAIAELSSPLPAAVKPLRYVNHLSEIQLNGDDLIILGKFGRGGSGSIGSFMDISYPTYSTNTRMLIFDYQPDSGLADDCYFGPGVGDSGSPVFVNVGAEAALVGINAAFGGESPPVYRNYCTAVRNYIPQLDAVLNPLGYRMRPVNGVQTVTLAATNSASPAFQRQAMPGSLTFTLDNTSNKTTHNATLTLSFASGQWPTTVSAANGWLSENLGGGVWSIRKWEMTSTDNAVVTASWTSLPAAPTLTVTATRESEGFAATTSTPSFPLAPSYAAWASGLAEAGQADDPDDDGVPNLMEYALGGNPQSGAMLLAHGLPLLPELTLSGGTVSFSFPERADAALRGLSYFVETSAGLGAPPWSGTLPPGSSSSSQPFAPAVAGFVKRTVSWPADGPRRFVRLRVALAE
jgi:hypothetical protein